MVSDDDLYVERRYFHSLTQGKMSPMEALGERYIEYMPCPTKLNPKKDWADYLSDLAKEAKVEGLISVALKYCEADLYDLSSLATSLSQGGVPDLMVETSHSGATGQLRTRLQAFLETIGGDRKREEAEGRKQ